MFKPKSIKSTILPLIILSGCYLPQAFAFKIPMAEPPSSCVFGRARANEVPENKSGLDEFEGTYQEYSDMLINNEISALGGPDFELKYDSEKGYIIDYQGTAFALNNIPNAFDMARNIATNGIESVYQDDFKFEFNGVVYTGQVNETLDTPFYTENLNDLLTYSNEYFDNDPVYTQEDLAHLYPNETESYETDTPSWFESLVNSIPGLLSDYYYLRIEGPTYVLKNQSNRFKGNSLQAFAYVNFHNDEIGYTGRDKSNYEANSYSYMTFQGRGPSLAWITGNGLCSAKKVWVQNGPEISASYDKGKVTIKYYADNRYSKAAIEGKDIWVRIKRGSNYQDYSLPTIGDNKKISPSTIPVTIEQQKNGRYVATATINHPKHVAGYITDMTVDINDGTFGASTTYRYTPYTAPIIGGGCTWDPTNIAGPHAGASGYFVYYPIGECQYHVRISNNGVVTYQ